MENPYSVELYPTAGWLLSALFRRLMYRHTKKEPRIGFVTNGENWKVYGFVGECYCCSWDRTEGSQHDR